MIGIRGYTGLVQLQGEEIDRIRERIIGGGGAWAFPGPEMIGDLRVAVGWPWLPGAAGATMNREGVTVLTLRDVRGCVWALRMRAWSRVDATAAAEFGTAMQPGLAHMIAEAFGLGARACIMPSDDVLTARSYVAALRRSYTANGIVANMRMQCVADVERATLELGTLVSEDKFRMPSEFQSEMLAQEQEVSRGGRGRDTPVAQAVKAAALAYRVWGPERDKAPSLGESAWPVD